MKKKINFQQREDLWLIWKWIDEFANKNILFFQRMKNVKINLNIPNIFSIICRVSPSLRVAVFPFTSILREHDKGWWLVLLLIVKLDYSSFTKEEKHFFTMIIKINNERIWYLWLNANSRYQCYPYYQKGILHNLSINRSFVLRKKSFTSKKI